MSIESSPNPSPYKGAPGSICAAGVSRLSEEVISWASLSSSAVIALPGSVSFIAGDRKSTRLNSSHVEISYAVFCLKKKKEPDVAPSRTRFSLANERRTKSLTHWPPIRGHRVDLDRTRFPDTGDIRISCAERHITGR